jgi:hypothetical protein
LRTKRNLALVVVGIGSLVLAWQGGAFGDTSKGDGSGMSAVQVSGPDFINEMRTVLGDEFGGGWIVATGDGEMLHIGVTNAQPDERQKVADAAARFGLSGSVQIDSVQYSHEQLIGFYETLDKIASGNDGVLGWGVQVDRNKVQLILSEPDEGLVDRIKAEVPADAFLVTVDPDGALLGM